MATYNISTLAQLQAMASHLADDCVLLKNIDASTTRQWNAVAGYGNIYYGFRPIGLPGTPFTGTFNGGGHTISNLYINRTTTYGTTPNGYNVCGMLGQVKRGAAANGFIKDLNILNADITGWENASILAGTVDADATANLEISNVTTSGSVVFQRSTGGGMVGSCAKATFDSCSTSASVTKSTTDPVVVAMTIGAFCGSLEGDFTDCSAAGKVTVTMTGTANDHSIGGFCGVISGTTTIQGCTATGDVAVNISTTGTVKVGGFSGNVPGGTVTITECFAHGDVTFAGTGPAYVGGFVSYLTETITKCGSEGDVENSSADATTNFSGGFAGLCQTGTSIANSYAKGKVCEDGISHASARIGGFTGGLANGTIATSYSSGAVYATGAPTNGGGFGGVDDSGTWTDCFWDKTTSGWTTSAGGTGKTTAEMHLEATFTNWDFDDVWDIATFTRAPGSGVTVWLSKVGDYENFKAGVNDADSFSLQLTTANTILWMEAFEAVVIGTSGDEWVMKSNKLDTPLTPNSWGVRQQTNYGSKNVQALKVNETILFIDYVGRKLREMTYSYADEKYVAPDLTALAEHITKSGVTSMAHQRNPSPMIWATLIDGTLIGIIYDREQDTIAWATYPVGGTDVVVQSVCVTPGTSEDRVTISVRRTINTASVTYIEELASRTFTAIEDCFFVDSGVTVENSPASATLAGLDHLIGETVKVLGDGVDYEPTAVVNASGEVTISTAVEKAQAGLAFASIIQPMRIVVNSQEGTSLGSITRINEIVALFLDTGAAQYGSSEDDMHDIDFTDDRWVNNSEITGLFSGEVVLSMPGGFSSQNSIIIKTEAPMPCTLAALVAKLDVTGR